MCVGGHFDGTILRCRWFTERLGFVFVVGCGLAFWVLFLEWFLYLGFVFLPCVLMMAKLRLFDAIIF